jgi:hypothetical protein
MGYIEFSENNSGGSFWLSQKNYEDLMAAGWTGEGITSDYCGGRRLRREGVSMRMALAEFYDATGYDGDEEGCSCCGQPFYFAEYDDQGKMIW